MKTPVRLSLSISIHPALRDHRFEGRIILPAVEILQALACSLQAQLPEHEVRTMFAGVFPRFLEIGVQDKRMETVHEMTIDDAGDVISKLMTLHTSPRGQITRAREHAGVCFRKENEALETLPFAQASHLDGDLFEISPEALYEELVPFGPAFRNVCSLLRLTESGAAARVHAAPYPEEPPGPLGSPFPLDAALHCACAWSQRFAGIVAFPVGFEKRLVFRPTETGQTYFTRIIPVRSEAESLFFDLWIYGTDGVPYEALLGVAMRDVSGGRRKPPAWVRAES